MLTYQIGPYEEHPEEQKLCHTIGLLGEIEFTSDRHRSDVFKHFSSCTGTANWPTLKLMDGLVTVDWMFLPANYKSALRYLLAGSATTWSPDRVPLEGVSQKYIAEHMKKGIQGVLSLQPIHAFNYNMLLQYVELTQGQQINTPFGSWREALGKKKRLAEEKQAKSRHLENVRVFAARGLRRDSVVPTISPYEQRRKDLIKIAKEIWPYIKDVANKESKRGRPPYRKLLIEAINEKGFSVTMREIRWIMTELRNTSS